MMEHKLEEIESQLTSTTSNFEGLQTEYNKLQDKISESKDKYKRAALICTDFLEDMLNSNPNILNDQTINFNLELLKTTPLEKLPKEEKVKLVEDLLKQIQPYLSTNNLSVDPPESKGFPMKGKGGSKSSIFK
jgi:type I site-specific restriction endonuclease